MKTIAVENEENFSSPVFKAVIIYDDVGHAARATALLERVADRTDGAMKCDVKLWRLDALWQPTLAAITNAVAADANLILFALNGDHPPQADVLNWLERWSAHRTNKDVAIALFGAEADDSALLANELERFAQRRGLAFFGARQAWENEAYVPGFFLRPHWAAPGGPEPAAFAESLPAESHWGIND